MWASCVCQSNRCLSSYVHCMCSTYTLHFCIWSAWENIISFSNIGYQWKLDEQIICTTSTMSNENSRCACVWVCLLNLNSIRFCVLLWESMCRTSWHVVRQYCVWCPLHACFLVCALSKCTRARMCVFVENEMLCLQLSGQTEIQTAHNIYLHSRCSQVEHIESIELWQNEGKG